MSSVPWVDPDPMLLGPILIEGLFQTLCQGIIFAQAVRYWEGPLDDTRRMKAYVGTLVSLSFLQTIVTVYKLWLIFVNRMHWSTSPLGWSDLFVNGLLCSVCETFLVRRCWKITGKNPWVLLGLGLVGVTTFAANVHLAVAIGLGSRNTVANNDPLKTNRYFPTVFSFNYWIFSSLVLDVTVTSILTVWLWRSKTGYGYLDRALKHIIGITWESAAVPFVSMVIAVSLYHTRTSEDRHLVMFFILMTGKFYILGIFRSLNSRGKLRERMKSNHFGRESLSDFQWDQQGPPAETSDSDVTLVSSSAIPPTMSPYLSRSSVVATASQDRILTPPRSIKADQLSSRIIPSRSSM